MQTWNIRKRPQWKQWFSQIFNLEKLSSLFKFKEGQRKQLKQPSGGRAITKHLQQCLWNIHSKFHPTSSKNMLIQYLSMYLWGDVHVILYIQQKDKKTQLFLECSILELCKREQKVSLENGQQQMRNYKSLGNQRMNEHTG